MTAAYAWNDSTVLYTAMWDAMVYGVVNPLTQPSSEGGISDNPYNSAFNDYVWWGDLWGNPGLIASQSDLSRLTNNLADPATKNFVFDGHGSVTSIGNRGDINLSKNTIGDLLGNGYTLTSKAIQRKHPYRFVFLFACDVADLPEWSEAFGIRDEITPQQINAHPDWVQAFLGFQGSPPAPGTGDSQAWYDNGDMLEVFFQAWMQRSDLQQCIAAASSPSLAWPITKQFAAGSTNSNDFKLVSYGYPWIKRTGYGPPH